MKKSLGYNRAVVPDELNMFMRHCWRGSIVLSALLIHCSCSTAANLYVSPLGGNVLPFADWSNAATNIQDAIDAASAGDVIWVTNGIYSSGGKVMAGDLSNRVVLDKAVTVQSVNGPALTVIQGAIATNGPAAVRCAWLTNGAVLKGFTIQGGATRTSGDQTNLESGRDLVFILKCGCCKLCYSNQCCLLRRGRHFQGHAERLSFKRQFMQPWSF